MKEHVQELRVEVSCSVWLVKGQVRMEKLEKGPSGPS